ncbi:MAG: type VII secretion protein EccB [Mycobacteriaceae bacterium]|nr:type VII secretion protein EccB [Mycobacteriaceae bacterium]
MPLNLASKAQVSGHYFVRRRLGFALLRRSVRMQVDPVRWQRTMLMLSAVVGVVMLVGAFLIGWFRPAGLVGTSKIVADRKLGTLYVSVDGRLHPALNLVSAQLISGAPEPPAFVSAEDLAKWPKGPTVGIIGAPVDSPQVLSPDVSRWAVCDTASNTLGGSPVVTGIDGELTLGQDSRELSGGGAALLSYHGQTYVVTDGVRMPVDLGDRAVTSALGVDPSARVAGMSRALFDALAAGGPLVVPQVADAGSPPHFDWGPGVVVGSVMASQDVTTGGDRFYVVLADGVQPVSAVVAAMLRQQNSYGATTPPRVSPDQLARVPVRHVLDVDYYPKTPLRVVDTSVNPVTCVTWLWGQGERQAVVKVIGGAGLPIRTDQQVRLVSLVGGGVNGVAANRVLLSGQPATFVTTTGAALDSPQRQTMWLISESGIRYGVPFDENALRALGLAASQVRPAPWAMLQVWPAGPELSRAAALTVHDALAGAAAPISPRQQGG